MDKYIEFYFTGWSYNKGSAWILILGLHFPGGNYCIIIFILSFYFRCQTTFWFGCRKHHCRSCGKLVCGDCSSNSLPLPSEQLYHPVRICDACFRKNSGQSADISGDEKLIESLLDDDKIAVEVDDGVPLVQVVVPQKSKNDSICPASDFKLDQVVSSSSSEWTKLTFVLCRDWFDVKVMSKLKQ